MPEPFEILVTNELIPVWTDDPDFIDRFLEDNEPFRQLEERRREVDSGHLSSLKIMRERLLESP